MNSKFGFCIFVAVGLAVVGGLVYLLVEPDADVAVPVASNKPASPGKSKVKTGGRIREARPSVTNRTGTAGVAYKRKKLAQRMTAAEDWYAKFSNAGDRALGKRLQDAQDADNRDEILAAAEEALKCKNAEVRQAAVEALSLQGEAAIPTLLKFVGDGNKEVAESAYRAWDDAVDGVESEFDRKAAIHQVLAVVKDEEHVKSAVSKIEMFEQPRAIRELAKLAKDGGKASAAAKESYENVTGEPFTSWAAAELKAMAMERENAQSDKGASENAAPVE